ncbi:hypothetical protein [Streptomyces pristinaespiralis]|uniref:Uncharacterized protein n=2 Tax=Streptomyces pristinaespiralis TaxID=38300 RepID=B5HD22_STRE2|nr:hypothetical protein [Streptomyces pristinaespiralis]ALC25229.1 hypothetical protein SPRI_6923 [Streptomyces pristinaespiralis]EDY64733.1 conserved hypothetical protein [Streptomyces pristinaespiralis ATCC 25486]
MPKSEDPGLDPKQGEKAARKASAEGTKMSPEGQKPEKAPPDAQSTEPVEPIQEEPRRSGRG